MNRRGFLKAVAGLFGTGLAWSFLPWKTASAQWQLGGDMAEPAAETWTVCLWYKPPGHENWVHLAGTFVGDLQTKAYVNGELVARHDPAGSAVIRSWLASKDEQPTVDVLEVIDFVELRPELASDYEIKVRALPWRKPPTLT